MSSERVNQEKNEQHEWSRRRQTIAAAAWASFLAACVATMLFFAYFDPMIFDFEERSWLRISNAMASYTLGFFFFWAIAAIAAALTAFLLKPTVTDSKNAARDQSEPRERK